MKRKTELGYIILDPFNGGGATTTTAYKNWRKFIGIELQEKYCKIARDRLKQGVLL